MNGVCLLSLHRDPSILGRILDRPGPFQIRGEFVGKWSFHNIRDLAERCGHASAGSAGRCRPSLAVSGTVCVNGSRDPSLSDRLDNPRATALLRALPLALYLVTSSSTGGPGVDRFPTEH